MTFYSSTSMTGRERVIKTLNFEAVDRIAVDLGGTHCSGAHVSIISKLRQSLGLNKPGDAVKVSDPYQMLGEIDLDLQRKLGLDIVMLPSPTNMFGFANSDWKRWRLSDGTEVMVPGKFNTVPDTAGNILQYPQGDTSAAPSGRMPKNGFYFDTIIRQKAINDATLKASDNLEEFVVLKDEILAFYSRHADELYRNSDAAIVLTLPGTAFGDVALVPAPFLKDPKGIRDIEEWYVSTILRTDLVREIFEQQTQIALKNLELAYQAVGNKIQIIWMDGTDLATQNSLFCSPFFYNDLYLPYAKKLNDWIHSHTKWKTIKHCCGACEPLIESFIQAGYDILNPVQCSAEGMTPKTLVEKYGGRIVFWGGGVDTQITLPFGTPDEVREQVIERSAALNAKGGFIFNAIHNIQANTPVENVLAMFAAMDRDVYPNARQARIPV